MSKKLVFILCWIFAAGFLNASCRKDIASKPNDKTDNIKKEEQTNVSEAKIFNCGLGFSIDYVATPISSVKSMGVQSNGAVRIVHTDSDQPHCIIDVFDPAIKDENARKKVAAVLAKNLKTYVRNEFDASEPTECKGKNTPECEHHPVPKDLKFTSFAGQPAYTFIVDQEPNIRIMIYIDYKNRRYVFEGIEEQSCRSVKFE